MIFTIGVVCIVVGGLLYYTYLELKERMTKSPEWISYLADLLGILGFITVFASLFIALTRILP